jgi:predicted transcriptional regulator
MQHRSDLTQLRGRNLERLEVANMRRENPPKMPVYRPGERGLEQTLGTLEAQVMNAVWDATEEASVEQVRQALEESGKKAAYTTVMTTMSRLHKKGLLARHMRGKAYFYTATVSRKELDSSVIKQVVDGLLKTFAEPAISYFVEALSETDPARLDSLAEIIEEKRSQERGV